MRVDLRHVHKVRSRGRTYYYHRPTKVRLPDDPASAEFVSRLAELNAGLAPAAGPAAGSIAALIDAYLASPTFAGLAERTKAGYRRDLDRIRQGWGKRQARALRPEHVTALQDRLAGTPAAANALVRVLRLVLEWGRRRGWVETNAAARPGRLKTGDGHRPWEEYEVEQFEARWPIGTWERTAFALLLWTGQRGGDVLRMTTAHLRGGEVSVVQAKTGARVWMPQAAELTAALDAWTPPGLVILGHSRTGAAVGADYFRHRMRRAIAAAGLPDDCTLHGLRYTAATRVAEVTGDWQAVGDVTGHATMAMARKYSEKRRRTRLTVQRLDEARERNAGRNPGQV